MKGLIEGVIRAQRAPSRLEAARLELAPAGGEDYGMLEYTGLAYFHLNHLHPDMGSLEDEIVQRLREMASSDDVDIQALALASLHFARGKNPDIGSFLADELSGLGSRDEAVRLRWVWILNFRAEVYAARGEHGTALAVYRKAEEILPDDPKVLRNVGVTYSSLGAYPNAIAYLRRSFELDPAQPLTLMNLAFAVTQNGDFDRGVELYRRAIEMNPYEPLTYLSLGRSLLRRDMAETAAEALERAVQLDPSMTEAQYALGLAYMRQRKYEEAVAALNRGLEFDPSGAGAEPLVVELQRVGVLPATPQ